MLNFSSIVNEMVLQFLFQKFQLHRSESESCEFRITNGFDKLTTSNEVKK